MPGTLSTWDLYRRIPHDLTKASGQGGFLSIGCIWVMLVLFGMELWHYMQPPVESELSIDVNTEPMIRINFNITALEMPCKWISIDVKDKLGVNRVDVEQNIKKYTLTSKQKLDHIEPERKAVQPRPGLEDMDAAMALDENSPHLDPDGFKKVLEEKKFVFVDFYAPWCIWCRRLAPTWENFAKKIHDEHYHVAVRKVDCVVHPQLCASQRIRAFPTMRIFKHGHPLADYDGERTPDGLTGWSAGITGDDEIEHHADSVPVDIKGQNEEHLGCLMTGFLMVNRVPGNFHLNAKSTEHNFNPKETNLSHVVHHLSFGDPVPPQVLHQLPTEYQQLMAPLDRKMYLSGDPHVTHEHYIKVVTTHYKLGWRPILGYQIQHTNHQYKFDEQHATDDDENLPEARFSYDLSPTAVTLSRGGRRWYEFATNLCAIIGGVFTVMGLLDKTLHGIRSKVFKEAQGKLG